MVNRLFILLQDYKEDQGSYHKYFRELAKHASEEGYEVTLLCGETEKKSKRKKQKGYAKIIRFPRFNFPIFGFFFNAIMLAYYVKKFFKNTEIKEDDLIIANGEAALGVLNYDYILRAGDQPAKQFKKNMKITNEKVGILSRTARSIHLSLQHIVEKYCIRNSTGIIYPSEETRDLFIKYHGHEKPYFIPRSGVNYEKFAETKKADFEGKNLLFISVRGERIRKGVPTLEKVLPELFDRFDDFNLIHLGDKFEWNIPSKYKDRIKKKGKVKWKKMKDYYAIVDVFVSASLNEGFPNTILEAMASGTPIISSNIEGIHEYIEDGEGGLIFERGDAEELKEKIEWMIEHPKKAKKMGKKAQKKIKRIDYKKYMQGLFNFMEEGKKPVNILK